MEEIVTCEVCKGTGIHQCSELVDMPTMANMLMIQKKDIY